MEDALVPKFQGAAFAQIVLILVLMEDALVLAVVTLMTIFIRWSLNPCFNGRCTRTKLEKGDELFVARLNPCFNGRCTRTAVRKSLKKNMLKS